MEKTQMDPIVFEILIKSSGLFVAHKACLKPRFWSRKTEIKTFVVYPVHMQIVN